MPLTTAAIQALEAGGIPVSILEVDLPDGSTLRAGRRGGGSETKQVKPLGRSFSPLTYGTSDNDGRVERVRTVVEVVDPEPRTLTKVLRGAHARNVRGSAARIYGLVPGLPEADWWFRFVGIVQNVEMIEPFVWRFLLRMDLEELRGDAHRRAVTRDDFPTAPDDQIGQIIPVVFGVHDSSGTNVAGMLRAIRVSTAGDPQNASKPIRYAFSEGRLPDVLTRWTDGASETSVGNFGTDWFWTNRNGHIYTELGFDSGGSDPGEDAEITVDAYGLASSAVPTTDPSDASEVVENPIEQLRLYLTNFVFNRWNDGTARTAWFDPYTDAPLEQVTWNAARAYFARKNAVGARAVPSQSVESTMIEFAESWQVGTFLQEEGKLGIALNDVHTSKANTYGHARLRPSDMRKKFALEPDAEQAFSRIRHRFFLVEATGEYLGSRTSVDPHRPIQREDEILMPWSGATLPGL